MNERKAPICSFSLEEVYTSVFMFDYCFMMDDYS